MLHIVACNGPAKLSVTEMHRVSVVEYMFEELHAGISISTLLCDCRYGFVEYCLKITLQGDEMVGAIADYSQINS